MTVSVEGHTGPYTYVEVYQPSFLPGSHIIYAFKLATGYPSTILYDTANGHVHPALSLDSEVDSHVESLNVSTMGTQKP